MLLIGVVLARAVREVSEAQVEGGRAGREHDAKRPPRVGGWVRVAQQGVNIEERVGVQPELRPLRAVPAGHAHCPARGIVEVGVARGVRRLVQAGEQTAPRTPNPPLLVMFFSSARHGPEYGLP